VSQTTEEIEQAYVVPAASAKFETKKFVLQGLLQKALAVLPKTDLVEVLKNFQIEVTGGDTPSLRVAATDLDLWALASTNIVTVNQPGTIALSGAKLVEIAETADDGDLVVEAENGVATISVKRTKWELRIADGSEYPPFPDLEGLTFYEIDRSSFITALQSVSKAATKEATRQNLAMVDVSDKRIRASDGVRYHQVTLEDWPEDLHTHIPIGAVDVLVKLLRGTEATKFQLADTDEQLVFKVGADVFVTSKLVVEFPNVDAILLTPALQSNTEPLEVGREDLLNAIRRVRITSDPETSAVALGLAADQVQVRSQDKFGNTAVEELDSSWKAADRMVAFNHRHLTDMLDSIDSPTCTFWLGKDTKTKRSSLLLRDDDSKSLGVLIQQRPDWVM
jgi:DNA polymerase III sliding clamp (beta) subunit (PCNA family)